MNFQGIIENGLIYAVENKTRIQIGFSNELTAEAIDKLSRYKKLLVENKILNVEE